MASLINQQITLDLIPGPVVKTVSVSQYDTGTRTLKFKIQNDGVDFTIPSGLTVTIQATKRDLTGFSYACTYSGSIVSVVVQPQMTVFPGKTMCEIVFTSGTDRIGSANFWLKVEDAALNDSTTISETVIPGIANLEQALQTAVEKSNLAIQSASDAEAWAVGTRNGTAVPSTDETYHNNSKYYADTFDGDITRVEGLVEQAEALVDSIYSLAIVSTASGDPATMTDGANQVPMKSLVAEIEPVQDLHGYSRPWVGGAGKNLLEVTATSRTENGVTFTVSTDGTISTSGTATTNVWYAVKATQLTGDYILTGCPSGGGAQTYAIVAQSTAGTKYDIGNGVNVTYDNTQRQIFILAAKGTNMNGLIFKPMLRLSTESDSTFAPYSNICPISGWDAVGVTRTSGNLGWVTDDTYTVRTVTAVCSGNKIKLSGTATGSSVSMTIGGGSVYSAYDNMVIGEYPAGTYRITSRGFVGQGTSDRLVVGAFCADGTSSFLSGVRISSANGTSSTGQVRTFTAPKPFKLYYFVYVDSGHTVDCTAEVELRKDSDAFDYSEAVWNKYSVALTTAGTVYGGTLDVVSGKLVVERKIVSGADLSQYNANNGYIAYRSTGKPETISVSTTTWKCSMFDRSESWSSSAMDRSALTFQKSGTTTNIYVALSESQDKSLFQLVYTLATPVEYQLTPTQVTTLLKSNVVWADCGEVTLEYAVNTKTYIDNLLASQA